MKRIKFIDKYPNLLIEWHTEKNGNLEPSDYSVSSSQKVWWKCNKGHEWQTTIKERARGSHCPYCTGNRVSIENSLKVNYPEIAAQWHPNKNGLLKPEQVSVKSSKKVWWICNNEHEWQTAVSERTRGYGCPYCSGRYASVENNLKVLFPEILKEWNYTKNELMPENFTGKSDKKVWWICNKGHEWNATIKSRTLGKQNCPYCAGKRPSEDYNFYVYHPEIAEDWNYQKNEGLMPSDFTPNSGKSVWWQAECGHEWKSKICNRVRGDGCPYCAGKRVALEDSLLYKYPNLANEWHIEKNKNKKPINFLPGSMELVWWKCNRNHEWRASINNRVYKKSDCPKCFGATSFNEQTVYYYVKQAFKDAENRFIYNNEYEIDVYIPSINLGIEYDGIYFHRKKENAERDEKKNKYLYENGVNLIRIRSLESPKINPYNSHIIPIFDEKIPDVEAAVKKLIKLIAPQKSISINVERDYGEIKKLVNIPPIEKTIASIETLVNEWSPQNDKIQLNLMLKSSKKKVWWRCEKGHEWEQSINTRVEYKTRCPYCSNKKAYDKNSLRTLFPFIAAEWHPIKNKELTPEDVLPNSAKKVWWKCKKGHEFEASPWNRIQRNNNCPFCSGKRINKDNCLNTTHPELSKEWNFLRNIGITPMDVSFGSRKKVWWKCEKGHEWEAQIGSRAGKSKNGCPYCSNKKVCHDNCLATVHPMLAAEWHPIKNVELPTSVVATSNKKVWWLCNKGHEWEAVISSRGRGSGCPHCYNLVRKKLKKNLT